MVRLRAYYHVTKQRHMRAIRKHGLKAKRSPWWGGNRVFLWDSKSAAEFYASWVRGGSAAKGPDKNVVLKVMADPKHIETPRPFEDLRIKASKKSIPAKHIRLVRTSRSASRKKTGPTSSLLIPSWK